MVRDTAVCGVLGEAELKCLRKLGSSLKLSSGETLFRQGDYISSVFTVTAGLIQTYRILPDGRRQVIGFHHPGDLVDNSVSDAHDVTAEALGDTRVCAIPVRRFDAFVSEHPAMERELYVVAAKELAGAREQMMLLGRKTAAERLASFFLALSDRSKTDHVINLPMSRSDIADYLGLTKETVSRVLAQLRNEGLIRLQSIDRVELLDRDRLRIVAAGGP
jgi:CRP/FNR family transcriptional regulator